jgi:hypothetical protein
MAPSKKNKKMASPPPRLDRILLRSAPGDPPATISGGNKWIKRWILVSKASGANLTVGDVSSALAVSSSKDSMKIVRIQAYSPMDTIGQSINFSVSQLNLVPVSGAAGATPPVLSIVDFGTGTSRAAAEAVIPENSLVFPIDTAATEVLCYCTASGTTPGAIVYRIQIKQSV